MQSQDYGWIDLFSFLYGLLSVPFTFFLARKIYYEKRYELFLYILNGVFAILAFVLPSHLPPDKPNLNLVLVCPIYSLVILKIGLYIFKKNNKRYPVLPGRNWSGQDGKHDPDRWFHFIFAMLSMCLPMFVLAYFYP